VDIKVFQGEREMARFNKLLGNFRLEGIPMAPRGMPQVEVTFDIDANGIMHVTAKDLGTGREQKIRIESSSGLSKDEVEKMTHEATSHAEEDHALREEAELRNRADAMAYATEKMLKDSGEKVPPAEKQRIEEAVAGLRKAMKDGGKAEIERAMEALTAVEHTMAEKMYAQATNKGPGASPDGSGTTDTTGQERKGDVVDAEFVDVEDNKK
jgi:molecular chaperone DnaK